MRLAVIMLLTSAGGLLNGCSSQPSNNQPTTSPSPTAASAPSMTPNAVSTVTPGPNASVAKSKVDVCTLLTSDEIKAVQGEPIKGTKASDRATGDFIVTQCYYELPTAANSISLTLTESNPERKDGQSVKESWEKTFGSEENKSEKEREKEKKRPATQVETRREGEQEESAKPERVPGVGDEAFWSASRVG